MERAVVLLHHYPEFMKQCCDLINSEWKRSETARLRSLESSSDRLPTCLILISTNRKVIGHCKLSAVPNNLFVCFVESVVIDRAVRGQGHGSYLMRKAEEYCKSTLSLERVYLSTKGQEQFYAKLGYMECGPVSIYGGYDLVRTKELPDSKQRFSVKNTDRTFIPKPPPIPMNNNNNNNVRKTFMYKDL